MDPVTAFVNLANTLADLTKEMVKSQPPDVQKQLWEWYVKDIERWRKILHLDG